MIYMHKNPSNTLCYLDLLENQCLSVISKDISK